MPHPATTRSVLLLTHVLRRGRVTTSEAAHLLDVAPRMALADLKRLEALQVIRPSGQGRTRVWLVDSVFAAPNLGVLDQVSLEFGRELMSFAAGTALHEALERVRTDGWDRVPASLRRNRDRKFRHQSEPARSYEDHRDQIDAVLDGLLRERRLAIGYTHHDGVREDLIVEPLTLVIYRRAVYLLGRRVDNGELVRLAVDRMARVDAREPFTYPEDFDPDAELGDCFGIVSTGRRAQRVVIRFSPRVVPWVEARTWHPTQRLKRLPEGGIELTMRAEGAELVRWVLEWGDNAEVVEPVWLREAVIAELRGALARYESSRGSTP